MVTVASYNIRKCIGSDRKRRPDRILEVLAEIDADVVALQEADRRFGAREAAIPLHLLAEHSDYRAVPFNVRHGSLGWHGNAVLVRKDVTIRRCQPLTLPALEPRGAVLVDLEVRGAALRIVGMHLDLSGLWRRRQARAILHQVEQQAEQHPVVLMGDMNEWSAGRGCLHDFGHRHACAETEPSFHARRPIARLDRIFVGQGARVEAAGVHRSPTARIASDHLPIWARLALP